MVDISQTEKQNDRDLRFQKMKEENDKIQYAEKLPLASGERGPYELAQEKSSTPDEQKASIVQPDKEADYKRQLGKERVLSQRETKVSNDIESKSTSDQSGQRSFREKQSTLGGVTSVSRGWQRLKVLRQRTKDKTSRLNAKTGLDNKSKALAQKMANEAVKKAWMVGHEIVEEALIANLYLLPIFGPIYILILIVRPLLAMLGLLVIKVKGVNVKLIPGYSLNEFFLRAKGAAIIVLITALEWAIILFALYVFTHPYSAAWEFIKELFTIAAGYK